MIRSLAVSSCFLLALTSSLFAGPLDPLLTSDNLWAQKQEEFMTAAKEYGFEWTSSSRDSARTAAKEMTAFGLPAVEGLARFGGDTLKELTIVLYARGDVGDWSEDKFDGLVRDAAIALNKTTNAKPTMRGKDPTSAVKAEGIVWTTDKARFLLEFSKTKEVKTRGIPFRAEFVRLEIMPPEKKTALLAGALASTGKTKFSGPAHVKKDAASGDVWIGDVPMVDQGQKGYCVVASTERVMRYYGNAVDQQELAQAANSSAAGTSYTAMFESLKKLTARLKIRVREVERSDIKDILKLMTDYNRAAKKANAPQIPDQGNMIDLNEVYRVMDTGVLKEVRTKSKGELDRFEKTVQTHVNEGTPLLWTVMLGKIPEQGIPQNAGGHMRLIIGYNTKTDEILFTDSWGAGHELKRMPAADAWTMTTGAMSIEPF